MYSNVEWVAEHNAPERNSCTTNIDLCENPESYRSIWCCSSLKTSWIALSTLDSIGSGERFDFLRRYCRWLWFQMKASAKGLTVNEEQNAVYPLWVSKIDGLEFITQQLSSMEDPGFKGVVLSARGSLLAAVFCSGLMLFIIFRRGRHWIRFILEAAFLNQIWCSPKKS